MYNNARQPDRLPLSLQASAARNVLSMVMLMADVQRKNLSQGNDETCLKLPEFERIMPATDFLERHIGRVRGMLRANWKSHDLEFTDVNVEDATIIQFLDGLRLAVNTTALLNSEQQEFLFNLLSGHQFEQLSCARVEGGASVDYWDAILPLATYINTCNG